MSREFRSEASEPPLNYDYFYDGRMRRQLHEFGATAFDFYGEVFRQMNYQTSDVALDIGAGMGHDGLLIAERYRPRVMFLLEPPAQEEDFDTKYLPIGNEIVLRGLGGIELLPSPTSKEPYVMVSAEVPEERITYIQAIAGVAEQIPLPDRSVNKPSIINSAYEFNDLEQALKEVVRVMAPDAEGVLVTNGQNDKLEFKKFLNQTPAELSKEAGEQVTTTLQTVSSKLDYLKARTILQHYFQDVRLFSHQDTMIIDEARMPHYLYAYDSYRRFLEPHLVELGKWERVKKRLVENAIRTEMTANDGIFRDTIDIGAVYFKNPY